eukprot:15434691-Alexandrium_andersonii.AAC.1
MARFEKRPPCARAPPCSAAASACSPGVGHVVAHFADRKQFPLCVFCRSYRCGGRAALCFMVVVDGSP